MSHFIRLCYCGIIIQRCRCPGPHTREIGPKSFCLHSKKDIREAQKKGEAYWMNPLREGGLGLPVRS